MNDPPVRILRKDRYGFASKQADPPIIIKISDEGRADPAFIQKKVRQGPEDFKKRAGREVRIPEKERLTC